VRVDERTTRLNENTNMAGQGLSHHHQTSSSSVRVDERAAESCVPPKNNNNNNHNNNNSSSVRVDERAAESCVPPKNNINNNNKDNSNSNSNSNNTKSSLFGGPQESCVPPNNNNNNNNNYNSAKSSLFGGPQTQKRPISGLFSGSLHRSNDPSKFGTRAVNPLTNTKPNSGAGPSVRRSNPEDEISLDTDSLHSTSHAGKSAAHSHASSSVPNIAAHASKSVLNTKVNSAVGASARVSNADERGQKDGTPIQKDGTSLHAIATSGLNTKLFVGNKFAGELYCHSHNN
jgi:hypothetical protein